MKKIAILAAALALALGLVGCEGLNIDLSRVNGNQHPAETPAE
jgi:hypothetical protein